MKRCPKCTEAKDLEFFGKDKNMKDGFTRMCKACKNIHNARTHEQNTERYAKNRDKERARALSRSKEKSKYNRELYLKHREQRLIKQKSYYENRKDYINLGRRKSSMSDTQLKIKNLKIRERINSNSFLKLKYLVRNRISLIFKTKGINKKLKSLEYLGCSVDFLRGYIEAKFTHGMTWENHSTFGWHLDHIIPISSAANENELNMLCHYTNLQPLWWHENLSKSGKILQFTANKAI